MIHLHEASQEIVEIIENLLDQLNDKYISVEFSHNERGVFLTCTSKNNETIKFRVIPDNERTSLNPPKTNMDYQNQGGHKALIEKMKRTNKEAWKIDVTKSMQNKIMEIGFGGSETNWNVNEFKNNFISIFLRDDK